MMSDIDLENWSQLAAKHRAPMNWRLFYARLLENIDFKGKKVLDIGGGVGLAATYALVHGAERATLLEPEAAGSQNRQLIRARIIREELGLTDRLTIEPCTLQEFDCRGGSFDVAILEASINHLDEDAVISLQESKSAREQYRAIIIKLGLLLRPGSTIVISDCARRNFFGDLGLRNPLVPSIDWRKHQQPKIWIRLFEECGFSTPTVRWGIHNTLGSIGRRLLGNAVAFYFISSYFILTMRYDGINTPEDSPVKRTNDGSPRGGSDGSSREAG